MLAVRIQQVPSFIEVMLDPQHTEAAAVGLELRGFHLPLLLELLREQWLSQLQRPYLWQWHFRGRPHRHQGSLDEPAEGEPDKLAIISTADDALQEVLLLEQML